MYEDPRLADKLKSVSDLVAAHSGSLPVHIRLAYANGTVVSIALEGGVDPSEEFLSVLGKLVAKDGWGLDVKSAIFAEPPPDRWSDRARARS